MHRFIFLFVLAGSCNLRDPKLEGGYTLVAARYGDSTLSKEYIKEFRTIKIFKNGYWIAVTMFGNAKITVERSSGGTYTLQDGKYIERVNFSSESDSIFGKTFSFSYTLNGGEFTREGIISNENCENCLVKEKYHKTAVDDKLQDTTLEGVWELQKGEWNGNTIEDVDFTEFKIYSYPHFAWAAYHIHAKDFIGVGGGTYRYDGKKSVEHVEYFSYYDNTPEDVEIEATRLPSGAIHEVTPDESGDEIWKKIQ